ncbi:hypothetical protein AQ436_04275 [Arthrobacter sp. EpRS66]|nr:hypothetical protein AQ436_04275 [Arthrobacter sp. EpRS66]
MRVEQLQVGLDALKQVVRAVLEPCHRARIRLVIINLRVQIARIRVGRVVPVVSSTPNAVLFGVE